MRAEEVVKRQQNGQHEEHLKDTRGVLYGAKGLTFGEEKDASHKCYDRSGCAQVGSPTSI
jgi:hypothetical protein